METFVAVGAEHDVVQLASGVAKRIYVTSPGALSAPIRRVDIPESLIPDWCGYVNSLSSIRARVSDVLTEMDEARPGTPDNVFRPIRFLAEDEVHAVSSGKGAPAAA